jgi:alpha-glucan, water dikinase
MGVVLAWLRLSAGRVLPWYDGGNYQGKDMAHVQKALAGAVAGVAGGGGVTGHLARLALAVLPRGGGDGDAIRMGILHLMRSNGIKEGHRPGIEDQFIAQWHQKLHSNTTRDDIAIGEAYLHFLRGGGDWNDFWWYLWEHHKLSKEDLAAMKAGWRTNGITGPAQHLPHLIPAFEHLLWIIKVAHSGADLDAAAAMARGGIPDDLRWDVDDLLRNRGEWWVPGKIVSIRQRMEPCWRDPESRDPGTNRNVLLLDIALESFMRTKVEGVDLRAMSRDDRAKFLELALDGGVIAAGSEELGVVLAMWKRLLGDCGMERWGKDWALAADAALEGIALAVACVLDDVGRLVQAPANIIGKAAQVDKAHLVNFGEEVVRGHALFPVSSILSSLQPEVRAIAGLSPWQMISLGGAAVAGQVVVRRLADMQGEEAAAGKFGLVVLSEELGGLEDVPPGVVAVLTTTPVDLLSHIAIRARNAGVMLASCADKDQWAALVARDGELGKLAVDAKSGAVLVSAATAGEAAAPSSAARVAGAGGGGKVELVRPATAEVWTLLPADYVPAMVGGKAMSLRKLGVQAAALGDGVTVPPSFALPFGCFERALDADVETGADLKAALSPLGTTGRKDAKAVRKALKVVRKIVSRVAVPDDLRGDVAAVGSAFAAVDDAAWEAIKGVWASKWTERAYLSRRACGIAEEDLCMGVLCMDLVAAEYAFVLHTADPVTGAADTVFGEVVVGLGETLVGNSPGRALSFSASKTSGDVDIHSMPSKLHGHFAPADGSLIARSDSNGEDLEGFAGAGLYDSMCARPAAVRPVPYADEPLMWDAKFRGKLVEKLVGVAKAVEAVAGSAQDVEGCVVGDHVYLLQSRAQV